MNLLRLRSTTRRITGIGQRLLMQMIIFCVVLMQAKAHVHLQARYDGNTWRLFVLDLETGEFEPDQYSFFVDAAARSLVANDPRYTNFLGIAGSPVWIIPQQERKGIVNLGIGSEAPSTHTFVENRIQLFLRNVHGPGQFSLYTIDGFGNAHVRMNSRDEIDENDFIVLVAASGHLHVNWAFSAPGIYKIHFEAVGKLQPGQRVTSSGPIEFTFVVLSNPPWLSGARFSDNSHFSLRLHSDEQARCRIEWAHDLKDWRTFTNIVNTSGTMDLKIPSTGSNQRFFRAVLE